MNPVIFGAAAMAAFVAGMFFFRFWKQTKDRFFLFFAIAFLTDALTSFILGAWDISNKEPLLYLARLITFGLILYAIIDKNRQSPPSQRDKG